MSSATQMRSARHKQKSDSIELMPLQVQKIATKAARDLIHLNSRWRQ
jgi:hypothetical protein